MSKDRQHHWITEHLWRALRASLLLVVFLIWRYTEDSYHLAAVFMFLALFVDQLHGLICRYIQKVLNWKQDFNEWE
jgi:hypothetical protein